MRARHCQGCINSRFAIHMCVYIYFLLPKKKGLKKPGRKIKEISEGKKKEVRGKKKKRGE